MSSVNKNVKIISVSALNNYLKSVLESDFYLKNLLIKGEISNYKHHSSGHLYFTLKDETSRVNCVMFRGNANNLKFSLEDGMKIILTGSIGVYAPNGAYQIYVQEIEKDGLGNLYLELEKLKKKLEEEGLFDESHKQPLPKYPLHIGVISAKEGAAIQDILTTIERRWPIAKVSLFSSLVQGENASTSVIEALNKASTSDIDVMILSRGGGSIEDLWPFNNEELARVIYNYKIPIISAIGHEIDFTIAEFVSDKRAPTPTAAAELATPNIVEVNKIIRDNKNYLDRLMKRYLEDKYKDLSILQKDLDVNTYKSYLDNKRLAFTNLKDKFLNYQNNLIKENERKIDNHKEKLILGINNYLVNLNNSFNRSIDKLDALSPLKVLKRGYASVKISNKIVVDINSINIDDIVNVRVDKGSFKAKVLEKGKDE